MILTFTWKELREHQGIWLTMAIMTVIAACGLPYLVAVGDRNLGVQVAALTLLGLTAAYGVVCGSMMFAGEHEGGTLVFLDIFLGRRGQLWSAKFAIGSVLVVTQALAVAVALDLLKQETPGWAMALVGHNAQHPSATVWLVILPVVSLEGYAFGLLGSSLTRRVLGGAAVAAACVTPVWLIAIASPPAAFFLLQFVVALIALALSYSSFVYQSREDVAGPTPMLEGPADPREQFLDQWEEFERDDAEFHRRRVDDAPMVVPAKPLILAATPSMPAVASKARAPSKAPSPFEVLWWLTFAQAWPVLWRLAGVGLLIGFLMPIGAQVQWPLATLLLGVVCGTAAFAPEQRDLSFQFMSAQHLPMKSIWRFKVLFWLSVAVLGSLVILFGYFVSLALHGAFGQRNLRAAFPGTVPERLGPLAFFGIWLVYGFCTGQVFVWLCRKNILAVLISFLVSAGAIGLWLPSLLCGGLSGWQLWAPPLILMLATWCLMRAWASGRIHERKPMAALIGFGSIVLVWMALTFGYRACELPDVGLPLDPVEFRSTLPLGNDNVAGKIANDAIVHFGDGNDRWLTSIAELVPLPVGMIETPRVDIQPSMMNHLPACREITTKLLQRAPFQEAGPAFEHLAQLLALSRTMRNKASLEGYLVGIEIERDALVIGLDQWLTREKPSPKLLRHVLTELNRHAAETPPPVDCLRTECFRSGGFLLNPSSLVLSGPPDARKVREQWLTGGVAFSLEVPWEAERNARVWQLAWAGLFRAIETPYWELAAAGEELQTQRIETRKILQVWHPAADGPGSALTRADMARVLDRSLLCDDRLFPSVLRLREASARSRSRVDGTRLAIALSLYRMDEGKSAKELRDLTPKYLPAGLPTDPYSGQSFRYRMAMDGEPAIVWSVGPDRIDHGGQNDGRQVPDGDPRWERGELDLITRVPQWR